MELLTVRESSLGAYTKAIQDAVLAGYRMSEEPSKYPWNDYQFNAVLELSRKSTMSVEVKLTDLADVQDIIDNAVEEVTDTPTEELSPTKQTAGRPRRKL